ncbi:MAG: hypothetical protein AABY16_04540 [Nanoarchaeota archaeon]|mgnify:CR=1 FL=1
MGLIDDNLEPMEKELENLNRDRGVVLSLALEIEDTLEGVIASYFVTNDSIKKSLLEINLINELTFEKKIQLFRKICIQEKVDKSEIDALFSSIKLVQEWRNKVAHWKTSVDPYKRETFLRKREVFGMGKFIQLDKEILERLHLEKENAVKAIIDLHRMFHGLDKK